MRRTNPIDPSSASESELRRIVEEFRQCWNSGQAPRLEDFLARYRHLERVDLLRELLSVELFELRKAGCDPRYDEYANRFPSQISIIDELFMATVSFRGSLASTSSCKPDSTSFGPISFEGLSDTEPRYRHIELLGQGGFGEVWKAYDELLERVVAIKGPRRGRTFSSTTLQAFVDEARKGAALRRVCDRIVNVIDVIDEAGQCFIVMDYMEGGSLAKKMQDGPFSPDDAAELIAELADILTIIHRENFVHRDIKPANILFDEHGRPHLADLGFAASEEDLLEEPDSSVGTLAYMPPEQAESRSNRVDGRADIYSLGIVFYQLLTGRRPYAARDRAEYLRRLDDSDGPKPPRQIDPSIPVALEQICLRCMQRNPQDRYQTAADIRRDVNLWKRSKHRIRRRLLTLGVSSLVILAGLTGVAYRLNSPIFPAMARPRSLEVTPLVFPNPHLDDESHWDLTGGDEGIRVHSKTESLLGLFRVEPGESSVFSIDLDQLDWSGRVGVFLGFRKQADGNIRFERIELLRWSGGFQWQRQVCRYLMPSGDISNSILAQHKVTDWAFRPRTLTVRIVGGAVDSIEVDGRELKSLSEIHPLQRHLVQDASGWVGVYNLRSEATFSNIVINGARRQVCKATSGPPPET